MCVLGILNSEKLKEPAHERDVFFISVTTPCAYISAMSESYAIPKSAIIVNDITASADREDLRPGGVPLEMRVDVPQVDKSCIVNKHVV